MSVNGKYMDAKAIDNALPVSWPRRSLNQEAGVEYHVLGPLRVTDDSGQQVHLPRPAMRALLAVLLLHANQVLTAARLTDLLWPEAEAAARDAGTIRTHVWALRKLLAPSQVLRTDPGRGYWLAVWPGELDLDRFRQLTEQGRRALASGEHRGAADHLAGALRLWREPALADLPDTPPMRRLAYCLLEERQAARHQLTDVRLKLGQHLSLVPQLAEQTGEYPGDERAWELLIIALYRCGRRADALSTFQRARTQLADMYGLDPGPALLGLQRQVLTDDPELGMSCQG